MVCLLLWCGAVVLLVAACEGKGLSGVVGMGEVDVVSAVGDGAMPLALAFFEGLDESFVVSAHGRRQAVGLVGHRGVGGVDQHLAGVAEAIVGCRKAPK